MIRVNDIQDADTDALIVELESRGFKCRGIEEEIDRLQELTELRNEIKGAKAELEQLIRRISVNG